MSRSPIFLIILAGIFCVNANATTSYGTLLTIFDDSLQNDAEYSEDLANYSAAIEAYPQARARILPNLQASGSWNKIHNHNDAIINANPLQRNKYTSGYTLSLSQPIFNLQKWRAMSEASSQVKKYEAIFNSKVQNLIIRVATHYFTILKSKDNLAFANSEKKANKSQLTQTQNRHLAGLDTISSVHAARAAFDVITARVIAEENILENNKAALHVLTGNRYTKFKTIPTSIKLIKPSPNNQAEWIKKAISQNYLLLAEQFNVESSKKNLSAVQAGHLPTLDATATYADNRFSRIQIVPFDKNNSTNINSTIGLELKVPLFQGGLVSSKVRQAAHLYNAARARYDLTRRTIESNTLQLFNSITSKIHQIKAYKQAVKSAQSSLSSTEAAYKQGTKTITDLLNSQKDLFNAKKALSANIYDYLLDTLLLKQMAGTLSKQDLLALNKLLG